MAKPKQDTFSQEEIDALVEKSLAITGPDEKTSRRLYNFIRHYFAPTITGLENIPDEPTLFIGNHAMLGLDGMIIMPILYFEADRFVRAMADRAWFQTSTGEKMMSNGIVLGDPEVCSALMEAGQDILVFPGGAAEANKNAEQKYSLVWRERYGFVRMAAQHGYNITPFGLVGPDDWYDHAIEGEDLLNSRLGKFVASKFFGDDVRADLIPPLPKGLFNTLIPKPQRCYLAIGEPVQVPDCRGKTVSKAVQKSVRAETADSVEALIADMLLLRAQQKGDESWLRRLLTR